MSMLFAVTAVRLTSDAIRQRDCGVNGVTRIKPAAPISTGLLTHPQDSAVTWRKLLHRGASGAFVVSVVGTGLGLVAHIVVARLIGKNEYGVYALMLSWVMVLATVAQAGQDTNVVRFLPTYIFRSDWGKAQGLRRGIGFFVLAVSIVMALIGCVFVHFVGEHDTPGWRATFYIGFAMLPVITQLQQSGALHRAFKRATSANAYMVLVRPIVLIPLLLLLALVLHRMDAPVAAAANAMAALLALAASAWHLSRAWPRRGRGTRAEYELRSWVRVGVQLSMYSIVWVVGYRLDVLILGAFLGPGDVGPYYAATTMAAFSTYALNAVNVALGPFISERYDAGDLSGLQAIARRAAHISLIGGVISGVVLALLGHWALSLFGQGFGSAYVPLLILVLGGCVASAFGPVDAILALTKYQKQLSFFVLLGVLASGITAVLLVPHFGATGAAIAFALAIVLWRSLALWYAAVHLRINPFRIRVLKRSG